MSNYSPIDNKPRKKRGGSTIALLISFLISGFLLYLVLSSVNSDELFGALANVDFSYLALLVLLFLLVMAIRAQRWRYLLPKNERPSFINSFDATMLGFMATYILPFRAGEIVRPIALNRFSSVRFSVGFASIVNERVFDVLSLFVFLGLCLSQMPNIPDLVIVGSAALGAIAGTIILMVALAYISPNGMKAIAGRVLTTVFRTRFPKLYERLNSLAEGLIDGLRGISSVQTLFAVMGLSLFLWFTMGIFYLIGLPVMGAPAAFWPGMMVNVIVALAVAAPSAPGFVGTFQFGCLIALSTLYDYPKEFSVAYSVVIHVVQAVIIIAVGSTVLFRRGLKLSEVR